MTSRRIVPFLLLAPLLATAAALPDYVPPPGLYRVDGTANMPSLTGGATSRTTNVQVAGGTGDATVRQTKKGGGTISRTYAGGQPHTVCFKPGSAAASVMPGGCVFGKPEVSNGVATFHGSCAAAQGVITMRKVDARTWEVATRIGDSGGGSADDDIAEMRKIYEQQAKSTDPAERELARKNLADLPRMAEEMRASDEAHGAAGPGAKEFRVRYVKVAEKCQ